MIRNLSIAVVLAIPVIAHAVVVNINFDEYPSGTLLTNQYASQGIIFSDAAIYDPSSISNPPQDNQSSFLLPSVGYNGNGSFRISFIDPITLLPTTASSISFTAYLGISGDITDAFQVLYTPGSGSYVGPIYNSFSSNQVFTFSHPSGIESITIIDQDVNAFDNFEFDVSYTPVPIPASIVIYTSALALLGSTRALR